MGTVNVIGSGFSGLASACYLAKAGYEVHLIEKNNQTGGRARQFEAEGFTFDMGPSWYWMPEVFEHFFADFGKTVSDYYTLERLDPSYQVFFKDETIPIPADFKALLELFEKIEKGSSVHLKKFLDSAEYKYKVGLGEFVHKPSLSLLEFADFRIVSSMFKLKMFSSIAREIRGKFKNEKLRQILEFPVLFLGATPENTPSLYSLMNYADLKLGTWYPHGGMHKIITGMTSLAQELGVQIHLSNEITEVTVDNNKITSIHSNSDKWEADHIICSGDYHHFEQNILPKEYRQYGERYWDRRVMAPSSLLFYIGVNKRIDGLLHHNLFFMEGFQRHAEQIYTNPEWPDKPLFYICAPSKTDSSVSPLNCENLFILIPIAPGLHDNQEIRATYYNLVMDKLEAKLGQSIRPHVIYNRSYCLDDFVNDYHAFKGNAYGLANTLMQTAFLKPRLKSKKLSNLYYAGQLTVPGPGVPPSLISGKVVAKQIIKESTR